MLSLVFTVLSLVAVDAHGAPDPEFTACTIQLSSSHEIDAFKKATRGQPIRWKELSSADPNWFSKACQEKDLKCDILIVSAHFAGGFFDPDSGAYLPLEALEMASCNQTCDNILKNPMERYFFSCNTLATKKPDHREEDYYQILVDDGLSPSAAERITEARYGPMGASFETRIRSTFDGVDKIYGSRSASPLGPQMLPFVRRYLNGIKKEHGSFTNYLTSLKTTEAIKQANEIFDAIMPKDFVECGGLTEADPEYNYRKRICDLYAAEEDPESALETIEGMLEDENMATFLPAIDRFLMSRPLRRLPKGAKAKLIEIGANKELRKRFMEVLYSYNTPYLRLSLVRTALKFGWIAPEQMAGEVQDQFRRLLTPPVGPEAYDLLMGLIYNDGLKVNSLILTEAQFPLGTYEDPRALKLMGELRVKDPAVLKGVLSSLGHPTHVVAINAFETATALAEIQDQDIRSEVAQWLRKEKRPDLRKMAEVFLSQSRKGTPPTQKPPKPKPPTPPKVDAQDFWTDLPKLSPTQVAQGLRSLSQVSAAQEKQVLDLTLRWRSKDLQAVLPQLPLQSPRNQARLALRLSSFSGKVVAHRLMAIEKPSSTLHRVLVDQYKSKASRPLIKEILEAHQPRSSAFVKKLRSSTVSARGELQGHYCDLAKSLGHSIPVCR